MRNNLMFIGLFDRGANLVIGSDVSRKCVLIENGDVDQLTDTLYLFGDAPPLIDVRLRQPDALPSDALFHHLTDTSPVSLLKGGPLTYI